MTKYHKINSMFKRYTKDNNVGNDSIGKFIPGEWALPEFEVN